MIRLMDEREMSFYHPQTGLYGDYVDVWAVANFVPDIIDLGVDGHQDSCLTELTKPILTYEEYLRTYRPDEMGYAMWQADPAAVEKLNQLAHEFNALGFEDRSRRDICSSYYEKCTDIIHGKA